MLSRDTQADQLDADGLGAALGQALVQCRGAGGVGVAGDLDLRLAGLAIALRGLGHHAATFRVQVGSAEVEEDQIPPLADLAGLGGPGGLAGICAFAAAETVNARTEAPISSNLIAAPSPMRSNS